MSSFNTLPSELIYKIFHYLDAKTIVRSLRCVCKRFYQLVHVYGEYDFNFQSIEKCDFLSLCNYIELDHVKSLTLSDENQTPGQIECFLSRYRLRSFTELRSLILFEIDDCYLSIILKDIQRLKLIYIKIQSPRHFLENTTDIEDITRLLAIPTLQKLVLRIWRRDIDRFSWPSQCNIKSLDIRCQNLNHFYHIVRYLPNLRKLALEELYGYIDNRFLPKPDDLQSFDQLKCLKLRNCSIDMTTLLIILSLTPTIEEFQLLKSLDLDDFISNLSQLERFIQEKLCLLNKFDFFLGDVQEHLDLPINIQSYIVPFQTSFWISIKKWFVICDYIYNPTCILLYTPSFYDPEFMFVYHSKQMARLTSSSIINNSRIQMDGVRTLYVGLCVFMPLTSTEHGLPTNIRFGNVNKLILSFGDQWSSGSLRYISKLIDLSKIEKLDLMFEKILPLSSQLLLNLEKLFDLTKNIHTLKFSFFLGRDVSLTDYFFTILCPLIPNHVQYLTLQVSSISQIEYIIQNIQFCSSITFEYTDRSSEFSQMLFNWLALEKYSWTYRFNSSSLSIWLNKKN